MAKRKRTREQTMIYKALHTLNIEQHEPHQKLGINSGVPGGLAVSAPPVIPIVILLNDTNII